MDQLIQEQLFLKQQQKEREEFLERQNKEREERERLQKEEDMKIASQPLPEEEEPKSFMGQLFGGKY